MDRYTIIREDDDSFIVEIKFGNGETANVRGFSTEEEAEKWVEARWREKGRRP